MKTKLIFIAGILICGSAHASFYDDKSEIRVSSTAGALRFNDAGKYFDLSGEYDYSLFDEVQITTELDFGYVSPEKGDASNSLLILVGGQFNFPSAEPSYKRWYAGAGIGISRASVGDKSEMDTVFEIHGGKRFAITKKFTYSPNVRYLRIDSDGEFQIRFLSFSYFF
jgi:hypothetical protein